LYAFDLLYLNGKVSTWSFFLYLPFEREDFGLALFLKLLAHPVRLLIEVTPSHPVHTQLIQLHWIS
jgi:hypothetical protein